MLLRRGRVGASDRIHQLIEKRALTLQKLRPRRINGEPAHPVDLRILPDISRTLRPLQGERVAGTPFEVEVRADREGGDDLSARLPQWRKGDASNVGRRIPQLPLELPAGGHQGVLSLGVLALRDRPRAVVLLRPKRAAGVAYQDF